MVKPVLALPADNSATLIHYSTDEKLKYGGEVRSSKHVCDKNVSEADSVRHGAREYDGCGRKTGVVEQCNIQEHRRDSEVL